MKIQSLRLRNFSAVKKAMDANEIFIDLSKSINKICLLIGPNGSGKTTILGMLQPFSDVGNLDVRNNNKLILDDKEGYKELVIKKDNDEYVIKHFYTPHKDKSHSVKSYISKNGEELNINGNVTSFKEYVKEELQIQPDYLKLIRLGSNVTSMIGLSNTERKTFMSKIMDDIGIFLEHYKSVNTKLRQLDEMISHTIDKLNRLNIIDKKEHKKEIKSLENELDKLEREFIDENNKLAILKNDLNEIDDLGNLSSNLKETTKKYVKMTMIMERKDQIESFDVNFYIEKITSLESYLESCKNEKENNIKLIQDNLNHLNQYEEQLRTYEVQYSKEVESDKEIFRMEENLCKTRLKLREYEDIIGDFKPEFSKNELENFILFLKNSMQIIGRTYEFGKPVIERVVTLMKSKKNVINYINSHLIDLDDKKNDKDSLFLSTLASRFMFGKDEIVIDCKEQCQAKNLFIQIQNILNNHNVDDKNETSEFYHDMEYAYGNIMSVLPQFKEYKDVISRLPYDIKKTFNIDSIYDNMISLKPIYDDKKMNELLSLVTEYDNYIALYEKYNEEEMTMVKFSGLNRSNYIKEQISSISDIIDEIREKISSLKNRNLLLDEKIKESNNSLSVYLEIKDTLEKYDEIKNLYDKYTEDMVKYNSISNEIQTISLKINGIKNTIDEKKTKLQKMISDLDQYESLNKDLKLYNYIYDEMEYTKRSFSSKEGIPLRRMNSCLDNIEDITNELLDIAYDGKIYLDKFELSPTEFGMPFYNDGFRLDDVKYASQGELSFLSVALSFALSSQVLSKYKIMLLDEIDGPLDSSNREKFIKILENQINRIRSEQSFLITHNSMFSSYPVDIIDLSFSNEINDIYPLANYIKIERCA